MRLVLGNCFLNDYKRNDLQRENLDLQTTDDSYRCLVCLLKDDPSVKFTKTKVKFSFRV